MSKYGYNKVTNSASALGLLKELIKGASGAAMGDGLLMEELIKNHGFQQFVNERDVWVSKLENLLGDEVYITGTIVKELTKGVDLSVKMKLFFLNVLGSTKLNEIKTKWISCSCQDLIQPVIDFVEKDNHLLFATGWADSCPMLSSVTAACYKSHTKSWSTTVPVLMPGSVPPIIDHTETTYGDAVRCWLNSSSGPVAYGLKTGAQPDNIIKNSHTDNPVGCFVGGTSVLLSDFSSTPIEKLQLHDRVVGFGGNIGTISAEKVVQTLDAGTTLFGFNDEDPFFLASHPFWSQDGWRAVNPHLSKLENPWLVVGQLTEGDYVRKVKDVNGDEIVYEWIKIDAINHKKVSEGTKVYGVHTREGPRSYHANGYLVFENYPEITTQTVVDGMDNLSSAEKKKLQDHLSELEPILCKVLGPGPSKAMASITKKYIEDKLQNKKAKQDLKVGLKELSLPHVNLQYEAGNTKLGSYSMPTKMSLVRGHLFLDDDHVPSKNIHDEHKVSWTRQVADGKWEHGCVKLHGNRLQGHGFLSLTQNLGDTTSLLSANFKAAAHVNKYHCYRSSAPETSSSSSTSTWIDLGELAMGTDCSSGSCKPVGEILIPPNMDQLDSLGNHVVFSVDSKSQLMVTVAVPPAYQSFLGYTNFKGVFSMDFATFSGSCTSYDATKPGFEGQKYGWKGVLEKNVKADELLSFAKNASLQSNIHLKKDTSLIHSAETSHDAIDGASIAPMAMTMVSLADQHLSVDELYLITPPDSKSVHELTFSMLQEGMKYEMNSDNRENILGVVKPNLSGDMATVADTYKAFFADRFANAYLMKGLSDNTHFKDKITDEQRNQLLYYWVGNDKGCLSQDADYNRVNNNVSRVAYAQLCPDVVKYQKSSNGGSYWAKTLYEKLLKPEILNGLALTAEISETMTSIQKQSMVLFCLSPDEDYGAKFYRKLMMTRLNEMSSYFVGNKDNEEIMTEIMTDSIHQLIVCILSGGDATTKEVTKELNKQLVDAARELNVEITDNAKETASAIVSHMQQFISEVMAMFCSTRGTAWDKLTKETKAWMERNPIKAGVGKFFSCLISQGLWVTSIVFTIQTFMNWKDLKPEQKASLIADAVNVTVEGIAQIPQLIDDFKTACANGKTGFKFIKNWLKAKENPSEIEMPLLKSVEAEVGEFHNIAFLYL